MTAFIQRFFSLARRGILRSAYASLRMTAFVCAFSNFDEFVLWLEFALSNNSVTTFLLFFHNINLKFRQI